MDLLIVYFHLVYPTMDSLTSEAIRLAYQAFKTDQQQTHFKWLRERNPELRDCSDERLSAIFKDVVSCFQSKGGKFFEKYVEDRLRDLGIPFQAQVNIDADGIIVSGKGVTIPDIVFGHPEVGTHISNYIVLSLKTTSRERSKLDTAWTQKHPPKMFYYGTIEADYPQPETFQENPKRKLVCVNCRAKDKRTFKMGFAEMAEEVSALLAE